MKEGLLTGGLGSHRRKLTEASSVFHEGWTIGGEDEDDDRKSA